MQSDVNIKLKAQSSKLKEKGYPVLCAGCEKEGIRTIVNWSTVPNSHGACPRHVREMWARARKRRRILEGLSAAVPLKRDYGG